MHQAHSTENKLPPPGAPSELGEPFQPMGIISPTCSGSVPLDPGTASCHLQQQPGFVSTAQELPEELPEQRTCQHAGNYRGHQENAPWRVQRDGCTLQRTSCHQAHGMQKNFTGIWRGSGVFFPLSKDVSLDNLKFCPQCSGRASHPVSVFAADYGL